MKPRWILLWSLLLSLGIGVHAEEEDPSIGHRLAMWLPNRLVDLDDIVSLGLGFGPKAGIEPIVTRFQPFFGSYGDQYFIVKGYDRQWGGGYESGWSWSTLENRRVEDTFGSVRPYIHNHGSLAENMDLARPFPQFDWEIYKERKRDLWAIGVDAGWLLSANAYLHPVEIADFLTGIFLYDLRGDDF
jgi:hypothetical protein